MIQNLKETDYYRTSDLPLASTLLAEGYVIEAIEKSGTRAIFLIKRDHTLDDLVQLYFTRQLRVEPQALLDCVKSLKTRIYSLGQ